MALPAMVAATQSTAEFAAALRLQWMQDSSKISAHVRRWLGRQHARSLVRHAAVLVDVRAAAASVAWRSLPTIYCTAQSTTLRVAALVAERMVDAPIYAT